MLGVFGLLALARIAVFILTVIAFLVWLHRAYSNLQPLGAMGLEYTPGMAVGGWFISIANLFVPYKVVKELWQESNPSIAEPTEDWQKSGAPGWLAAWWTLGQLTLKLYTSRKRISRKGAKTPREQRG